LSPIDLIPDFIPVLGYLDDVIIVPLGIWIVVRMIPVELMREYRAEAASLDARPASRARMLVVAALWIVSAGLLICWLWPASAV
jgi:uncharacterized membrane protein YkvA (DUF1232 family)